MSRVSGQEEFVGDPNFAANVRAFREELGLSQTQLGERLGVSKGAVSAIETGRNGARRETIQRMLEVFDCSLDDLFAGPSAKKAAAKSVKKPGADDPASRYVMVPHFNVRAGLGNAKINEHHVEVEGAFPVPKSLVLRKGWREGALRVITMVGDSMETTIYDGDPGVINTDFTTIRSGGVYAFIDSDGAMSVKRLHRDHGRIRVTSDNLNKLVYPDTWFSPDDRIEILGELVYRSGSP